MIKKRVKIRNKIIPNLFQGGGMSTNVADYGAAASGFSGIIGDAMELAKGISDEEYEYNKAKIKKYGLDSVASIGKANTNTDLLNTYGTLGQLQHVDFNAPNFMETFLGNANSSIQGFQSGSQVGGLWGGIIGGIAGGVADLTGRIVGNSARKRKQGKLNESIDRTNTTVSGTFSNKVNSVDSLNDQTLLSSYYAYGGPLGYNMFPSPYSNIYGSGAIGYELANRKLNNQELTVNNQQKLTSLPNSFQNPTLYNSFDGGGDLEKAYKSYVNPTSTAGRIGKSVIQILDPSGISSYPDLINSGKEYIENPSWKNLGNVGFNLISALPLIGKATAPFKGAKMAKLLKGTTQANNLRRVNDKIDTIQELIPIIRQGKAIKNVNKHQKAKIHRNFERNIDILNIANPVTDIIQGLDSGDNIKALEGWLNTQGGDFTNGVTFIDEGGSHEENPYQGIQIGVDPEGAPNLVEQGEVVYDDYVFSDRMEILDDIRKKYKLRGKTFAQAAKYAQRESEERPNDPISKRNLEVIMGRLAQAQEEVKQIGWDEMNANNIFAKGGKKSSKELNKMPFVDLQKHVMDIIDNDGQITYKGTIKDTELAKKRVEQVINFNNNTLGNISEYLSPTKPLNTKNNSYYSVNLEPAPIPTRLENPQGYNTQDYLANNAERIQARVGEEKRSGARQTMSRYAPIIGSGLASLSDLFSRPDYSSADMISGVDLGAEAAGYAPIGNYLSYRPLDRDFYINKMNQQAAATRRGLVNTSGGNRLNAQAGILAADYNYGQNMGNLARQAEEYNQQLRERVEAFNRGTNMFNTETGLKASMFNAESRNAAKRARLGQATTAAQMRQAIKDQDSTRRSANMTNFLQGLGDMGWENEQANWLDTLAKSGVLKMNTKGEYNGGTKQAEGGKLRTKKKKGLTYG